MSSMKPGSPRRYRMRAAPRAESSMARHARSVCVPDSTSDGTRCALRWLLVACALGAWAASTRAAEPPGAASSSVSGHVPEQNRQAQQAPTAPGSNEPSATSWWTPGSGKPLAALATYRNALGSVGVLNAGGAVATRAIRSSSRSGRTAAPASPAISPPTACRCRWRRFRSAGERNAGQGSDLCGRRRHELSGPAAGRSEVALAAARARPVPRVPAVAAQAATTARAIEPEFTIEVDARSDAAATLNPRYGLNSADTRRCRSIAARGRSPTLKYVTHQQFRRVRRSSARADCPRRRDPETGLPTAMNMMADARSLDAEDAGHRAPRRRTCSSTARSTPRGCSRIVEFESQVYAAQSSHRTGRAT